MNRGRAFRAAAALAAAFSLALALYAPGHAGASAGSPAEASTAVSAASVPVPEAADVTLEHPGFRQNGTVYLLLKDLAPVLDLQLLWDKENGRIEVTGLYQALTLKIGQSKAYTVSGKTVMLGGETLIRDGVTYVSDKLFAKAFGIRLTWKGGAQASVPYSSRFLTTSSGRQLFWLNREHGVLYSGPSGTLPKRAGTIHVTDLGWVSLSARRIHASSYAVEIENSSGEPHISNTRLRALIYNGSIVRQARTRYWNPRMLGMKEDVFAYRGNVAMVDGTTLRLVNPDGHIFKTYDLLGLTGMDDAFAVEAVESEFLLVRPFRKGTLILIDRRTGESAVLYKELLSADDQAWLEAYPDTETDYPGDQLEYAGHSGDTLSFEWTSFNKGQRIHFSYSLSPLTE